MIAPAVLRDDSNEPDGFAELKAAPSTPVPDAEKHALVNGFLTSFRYSEEAMPRITDDTPLIDVFLEASQEVFAYGASKTIHRIPQLDNYLLGITKHHKFGISTDFLSSLAENTALTSPNLTIPNDGLLPLSYGKAVVHITSGNAPFTTLLGIHRKIEGQTLHDFYGEDPAAAKRIMATWPPEVFEDFMQQGLTLEQKGYKSDFFMSKNVIVFGENTENPKLTLIDPWYGKFGHQFGAVNIFMYFKTQKCLENPPELLEKLC